MKEKIIAILKEELMIESEINITDHLSNDLGADSLDAIEIIMELESEFDIEIADSDCQQFIDNEGTVESLIETIQKYIDMENKND